MAKPEWQGRLARAGAWMAVLAALASLAVLRSQRREDSGYESYARYAGEEGATAKGEQLGLGSVSMEGPAEAVVDSLVECKFRFTVGPAGIRTGGGVRIATRHGLGANWGGERAQIIDPRAENYLSFRTSTGSPLQWSLYQGVRNPLFERYHPWQQINEFKLAGPNLKSGDRIEIVFGDRSAGSPGIRLPRWDETAFSLKFYVDAKGDDDYLPLARNPQIRILAGRPDELNLAVPSEVQSNQPFGVHAWVGDAFGNPAAGFQGTLQFDPLDGASGLPAEYRFTATDRGAHRFEGVVLSRPGVSRFRVREKNGRLSATSNPIVIRSEPAKEKIYWGDLHTHTMYSDGRGSPAETYDFGRRVSALDFCAVTDHAFLTTDRMWREIQETSNRFYEPGRYVTFLAYEWSGQTAVGGDHNVYTTESEFPIYRSYSYYNYRNLRMYHGSDKQANHVEDLFRLLGERYRDENILVIPHFGGRPGNPAWHNPKLQRQIEIFSDHRRSEAWASTFLEKGYRLGIMASTDNHAGNAGYGVRRDEVRTPQENVAFSAVSPAERGTSLVAVYATELTREAVFQALYHRRTYATTGSRILLRFTLNGAPMGAETRVSSPPVLAAEAVGTAPVRSIRLVKNGRIIHAVEPNAEEAKFEYVDTSGDYQNKYYYIDLVQWDGKKAISSPIWVN